MKGLEQSKVETIANNIEIKLFNLHGDINPKYKNKYRSLVFNLKDVKNQVKSGDGHVILANVLWEINAGCMY